MANREPEYRRRVRENRENEKRQSERERNEASQDARIEKIIASIEGIVKQIDRYTDEKTPENRCKRRWDKGEVIGLWAAAAVGIVAILVGSDDSSGQRGIMQRQLTEMEQQRLMTIAQTRAEVQMSQPVITAYVENGMPAKPGEKAAGWHISPRWVNSGATKALDLFIIAKIERYGGAIPNNVGDECITFKIKDSVPRKNLGAGRDILQLADDFPVSDVNYVMGKQGYYLMSWHTEYRDIYPNTPLISENRCSLFVPNDPEQKMWSILDLPNKTN